MPVNNSDLGIPNSVLPAEYYLSPTRANSAIQSMGVDIQWRKSHLCPCGGNTGSPEPGCQTCFGWGRYWDDGIPFVGNIFYSFISDPTQATKINMGTVAESTPLIDIPSSAGIVFTDASTYDQFVLTDTSVRFQSNLIYGGPLKQTTLPYSYSVLVSSVTYWDLATQTTNPTTDYTVNIINGRTQVLLNGDFPPNTPYAVEYMAAYAYVAYGRGALPHQRPFGLGMPMPTRFQLEILDVWMRGQSGGNLA